MDICHGAVQTADPEALCAQRETREMKKNTLLAIIGAAAFTLCGCKTSGDHEHGSSAAKSTSGIEKRAAAVAMLNPTAGNSTRGTVYFVPVKDGVRVVAHVTGLTPGKHGFHVHEKGDCSAPDGTSAGGHFNPEKAQHGGPHSTARHAGDFGNITANEAGVAHYDSVDHHLKLEGISSVIGKAVIVHAQEDDLKTQPTGNAGARVACGVIEKK